jgi:Ca2+-binding EF-hand superfamily protein
MVVVSGRLDEAAFTRALSLLGQVAGKSRTESTDKFVSTLFELFDTDGNGFVDFEELASGVSVFCAGTTEEKVRAAFALYGMYADIGTLRFACVWIFKSLC